MTTPNEQPDRIHVAIRMRPMNERELKIPSQYCAWVVQDKSSIYAVGPGGVQPASSAYTFDQIFADDQSTGDIYNSIASDIIVSTLAGVNGTIFAYGQTSSGKTHTMQGDSTHPGVIPLAIKDVFDNIGTTPDREFLLRMSYLEIYNEMIRDLLTPEHDNLKIHETVDRKIYVGNLTEEIVTNADDVFQLLAKGEGNRHVGVTNMNERSSRSHTIFRMVIESRERNVDDPRSSMSADPVKISCLNLVDLAGSERVGHTGAEGIRLKEGGHINKSLLTLGTVIKKLSDGNDSHIPYRDSKLTRILQPSLGGNARTAVICTITPACGHVEESLSTLKFASRAKSIRNTPEVNEVINDEAQLKRYRREIETLKRQVQDRASAEMIQQQLESVRNEKLVAEAETEQHRQQTLEKQQENERMQQKIVKLSSMILNAPLPHTIKHGEKRSRTLRRQTFASTLMFTEAASDDDCPESAPKRRSLQKVDIDDLKKFHETFELKTAPIPEISLRSLWENDQENESSNNLNKEIAEELQNAKDVIKRELTRYHQDVTFLKLESASHVQVYEALCQTLQAEREILLGQIEEQKKYINRLQFQLDNSEESATVDLEEITQLREKLNTFQHELAESTEKYATCKQELDSKYSRISQLDHELQEAQNDVKIIVSQIQDFRNEHSDTSTHDREHLVGLLKTLSEKHSSTIHRANIVIGGLSVFASVSNKELEETKAVSGQSIIGLQKQLVSRSEELISAMDQLLLANSLSSSCANEVLMAKQQNSQLAESISSLEKVIDRLEEENENQSTQLDEATDKADETNRRLFAATREIEELKVAAVRTRMEYLENMDRLTADNGLNNSRVETLETELANRSTEVETVKAENESLRAQVETLKGDFQEYAEGHKAQHGQLISMITERDHTITELDSRITTFDSEKTSLQDDISQKFDSLMRAKEAVIVDLSEQITVLNGHQNHMIITHAEEIARLSLSRDENADHNVQELQDEKATLEAKNVELLRDLNQTTAVVIELRKTFSDLEDRENELLVEFSTQNDVLSTLKSELEKVTNLKTEKEELAAAQESTINENIIALDNANALTEKLETKLSQVVAETSSQKERIAKFEDDIICNLESIAIAENKIQSLQDEISVKTQALLVSETRIHVLEVEITRQENASTETVEVMANNNDQITSLQHTNEQTRARNHLLEVELIKVSQTVGSLRANVCSITEELLDTKATLISEIAHIHRILITMGQEVLDKTNEIMAVKEKNLAQADTINCLIARGDLATSELGASRASETERKLKIKHLDDKLKQSHQALNTALADVDFLKASLSQVKDSEVLIESLEHKVETLKITVAEYESFLEKATIREQEFQHTESILNDSVRDLSNAAAQSNEIVTALHSRIASMENEKLEDEALLNQALADNDELRSSASRLDASLRENHDQITRVRSFYDDLKAKYDSVIAEKETVLAEMNELRIAGAQHAEALAEHLAMICSLSEKLEKSYSNVHALTATNLELRVSFEKEHSEYKIETDRTLIEMDCQLQTVTKRFKESQQKLTRLEAATSKPRSHVFTQTAPMEVQSVATDADLQKALRKIEQYRVKADQLKRASTAVDKELRDTHDLLNRTQYDLSQKEQAILKIESQLAANDTSALTKQLHAKESSIKEWQRQLEQLREEKADIVHENKLLKHVKTENEKKIASMRNEIVQEEQKREQLQQLLDAATIQKLEDGKPLIQKHVRLSQLTASTKTTVMSSPIASRLNKENDQPGECNQQ